MLVFAYFLRHKLVAIGADAGMFVNKVSCMSASKNDLGSLLSSLVPRLWSFAFRLAGDECVAEQLVQQACACC